MLKNRVIATVLVQAGQVVQSVGFKSYLPVGRPEVSVEFLNDWGADEIIVLDISATSRGSGPDLEMISRLATRCSVPLTVGGGISSIGDIHSLLRIGADKVCLNQSILRSTRLLEQASEVFGAQCLVASIDALAGDDGYGVFDYLTKQSMNIAPSALAQTFEHRGAGEIYLNSVSRDGSENGFDLQVINKVCQAVGLPVIACGGAGRPSHFVDVFSDTGAKAAAAGNFFHFSEHSITVTKSVLRNKGIQIRSDTPATYLDASTDERGRLLKKPEHFLEELLFTRIEKEVI